MVLGNNDNIKILQITKFTLIEKKLNTKLKVTDPFLPLKKTEGDFKNYI